MGLSLNSAIRIRNDWWLRFNETYRIAVTIGCAVRRNERFAENQFDMLWEECFLKT